MPVAPDVIAPDDSLDDEYGDIDHGTVAPLLETGIPVVQTVGVVDDVLPVKDAIEKVMTECVATLSKFDVKT